MDEVGIRKVASRLEIDPIGDPDSNGWMKAPCPFAQWTHDSGGDSNPSFGIKINDEGYSHYNCFTCKHKGRLPGLAYKLAQFRDQPDLRDYGHSLEEAEASFTAVRLPDYDDALARRSGVLDRRARSISSSRLFGFPGFYNSGRAWNYIRKRGISYSTAIACGLRYDASGDRILFPVHDYSQRFLGFHGRAISESVQPKSWDYYGLDKEAFLYGEDYIARHIKEIRSIVVVEGPIDRLRLFSLGYRNAVALFGSVLTPLKANRLIRFNKPVTWMVDNDAAGETTLLGRTEPDGSRAWETGALARLYDHLPQFIVEYPEGVNDPGELNAEQAKKMLAERQLYIK